MSLGWPNRLSTGVGSTTVMVAERKGDAAVAGTVKKWNLTDAAAFPAWHDEYETGCRRLLTKGFVGSRRPIASDLRSYTDYDSDERSIAEDRSNADLLEHMQLEWDNNNEILYEYLLASIDVGWASRDLLKREYGPDVGFRGQELHVYVMAKCSADSEVKQRQVAQQLKEVTLSATASPQEVEEAFNQVHLLMDAHREEREKPLSKKIEHCLNLIPTTHPDSSYISTALVLHDQGGLTAEWASFIDFRDRIINALAKAALSRPSNEIGFPSVQGRVSKERENWRNRETKDTVDTGCFICTFGEPACKAKGNSYDACWGKCCMNPKAVDLDKLELTPFFKHTKRSAIRYYRIYMKEKKLKTIKGVKIPNDFFNRVREEWARKKAENDKKDKDKDKDKEKAKPGMQESGNACLPSLEDEDELMEWLEQQDDEAVNVALVQNPFSLLMSYEEHDDAMTEPPVAPAALRSSNSPTMQDNVEPRNTMVTPTHAARTEPSVADDDPRTPVLSGASTIVPAPALTDTVANEQMQPRSDRRLPPFGHRQPT